MSWLIIGIILAAAFGPIIWMVPSRSDRRLAKMRTRARVHGLQVEMTHLDNLAAVPSERVSAGGVKRSPKVACAEYRLGLRRVARAAPQWKILYNPGAIPSEIPGAMSGATDGPIHNWIWDSAPSGSAGYWLRVADVVAQLPADSLALVAEPSSVSCCWRERATAEDAVTSVDRLFNSLKKIAEIQIFEDSIATKDEVSNADRIGPAIDP